MMKTAIRAVVVLALLVPSHLAFAVISIPTPTPTPVPTPAPVTTPAPSPTPPYTPPPTNTINNGANTGQGSQDSGSAANAIAAAMLMMACMATQPPNMALCAMGALAAMQAGHDSGASGQSGNTANATVAGGGTNGGGTGGTDPTTATSEGGPGSLDDNGKPSVYKDPAVQAGLNALHQGGWKVDEHGAVLPDGKKVPASAFNSPSSMSAAGLDGAAAAKILPKINAAVAAATAGRASSMGLADGGGGGSSGAGINIEDYKLPKFANPFGGDAAATAKMLAGKTVLLGGEPVGVKMDNIFAIINRAYGRKNENEEFFRDRPAFRLPASTLPKGKKR